MKHGEGKKAIQTYKCLQMKNLQVNIRKTCDY